MAWVLLAWGPWAKVSVKNRCMAVQQLLPVNLRKHLRPWRDRVPQHVDLRPYPHPGMAANLQSKLGTSLHVYNRTAATAEIFCQENRNADGVGPTAVGSLSEMASSCSHVFIMLANDDACRHVVSELCDGLLGQEPQRQPFVVINCSTILPSTGNELAAQLERVGATHVACPVFGRPDAAAAGSLMAVLDANVIAGPHGDGVWQYSVASVRILAGGIIVDDMSMSQ